MIALDNRLGQNKNESPAMIIMSMLVSPPSFLQVLCFALLQYNHPTAVFALCWIYSGRNKSILRLL